MLTICRRGGMKPLGDIDFREQYAMFLMRVPLMAVPKIVQPPRNMEPGPVLMEDGVAVKWEIASQDISWLTLRVMPIVKWKMEKGMRWIFRHLPAARLLKYRLWFPRFIYHSTQEPNMWDKDGRLRPLVSNALQICTWGYIGFMQKIGFPIADDDIKEIFVHGSTTNFYYDSTSDIDVCILMDMTAMRAALPGMDLNALMKSALGSWRRNYRIRICGRGVDFEIVDINEVPRYGPMAYKVGPMYSIPRDVWLRRPVRLEKREIRQIRRQAHAQFRNLRRMYIKIVQDKMASDFIETFIGRLGQERKQSYAENPVQPITPRTMAFRMARRCGILRDLRERAAWLRSKNFNVE